MDRTSCLLYSTDASLYQIVPIGVVIPLHEEDVQRVIRIAAARSVPVLPRGSGTSLAGQTVGAAVVLDFTRYMNRIEEVHVGQRWARVQPGVILDQLNAHLRPHGLMFGPDVATSNRASIGGMMGNNSCGSHSIRYGRTVDHVLAQRAVLSDGSLAWFYELSPEQWEERQQSDTLEGRIYREVRRICGEHALEIHRRFPRIMRRSGGYNLDEIVRHQRLNLARILVGSEGTLATVTEATLNLVPRPPHSALIVSHFTDLIEALEAAPLILEHEPAAVELVDRMILELTRDNRELARARSFLRGNPEAILVTELTGETPLELAGRVRALTARLERVGYGNVVLDQAAEQQHVWKVRNAGLGLLQGKKGDTKPVGFVEDTAVAPQHLADYIREFRSLLSEYELDACYYAHASVGCLHVRPLLNLKLPADVRRMREITGRVAELVLKYGGALSAEHGDGLVRSEWMKTMFGPEVYQAFRDVKRAWDPHGIMNPGKIVEAPKMTENLRFADGYQTFPVETHFDFSTDGGFARHVELCTGVGACRKRADGAMCPSFRATQDEEHSTRGRANMLRAVLSGQAGHGTLGDPDLFRVLELCLECKSCKSECPSNVDMAKLKYEFLAHYHDEHGAPLQAHLFANAALLGRLSTPAAPLVNALLRSSLGRAATARVLGIDPRRPLPPFAHQTFTRWFRRHRPARTAGRNGTVALLADTFTNYHEPEIGKAAVRVLEAFGYAVMVPEWRCCGRPLISKGFLREAKALAIENVPQLVRLVDSGIPCLGLEPSCLVTLKDEYREFRLGPEADRLARGSWLVEEFLAERHAKDSDLPFRTTTKRARFHPHCHHRAVLGTRRTLDALRLVPGLVVEELPAGCCGMAGSFGFEHYDLSMEIGELGLLPAVRKVGSDDWIVANGTSCRQQLLDGARRSALHPIQVLAESLLTTNGISRAP